MDQNEQVIKIIVDLNSEESIGTALDEYIELFQSGEIGKDKEIGAIEFGKKQGTEITQLYLEDCPNKEEMVEHYMFLEDMDKERAEQQLTQMKFSIGLEETYYITHFSEAIFFSTACKYPNLKDKVVQACELIANYSKSINDTNSLWFSNGCDLAGIDALYFLAMKDPKYLYLISKYIIYYWDTEHCPLHIEYRLKRLFEHYGMRKEYIKAFAFSVNPFFIYSTLPDDMNLIDYFEKNPEYYPYFKELTIKRFINEDYIITRHDENLIELLYESIVGVGYDEKLPEYWNNEFESVYKEVEEKRN